MENIKLKNQAICKTENVIYLNEINTKKIIVVKENFRLFSIHHFFKNEKGPLIIEQKCMH